jgi:hypothetical protein
MVLLDPPVDAPPVLVHGGARCPPRKPTTDGLGGDEFSPMGGSDGCVGDTCPRFPHPGPYYRIGDGVGHYDLDGDHKPYGLGTLSARTRSWSVGELADNSDASSETS